MFRSGTEEQYGEKEILLEEIRSLKQEFMKGKKKMSKQLGHESRENALHGELTIQNYIY